MRRTFTKVAPLGVAALLLLAAWGSVPAGAAPARPGPIAVEVGDSYGPVAPTEALWSIANRLRPEGAVTVQQMMMALLRANPDAFFHDNVNWLKRGRTLRLPAASELRALSAREALLAIKSQNDLWRAADGVLPGVEPERLAAPSADLVEAAPAASPQPVAVAETDPEPASAAGAGVDAAGLAPPAPAQSEGAGDAPEESAQGPLQGAALPLAGETGEAVEAQEPPPAKPVRKKDPVPVVASTPAKTAAKEEWEFVPWIETKTAALIHVVDEFAQDWLPEEVWENLPGEVQENLAASVLLAGLVLFLLLILWWFRARNRPPARDIGRKTLGAAARAPSVAPRGVSTGATPAPGKARSRRPPAPGAGQPQDAPSQRHGAPEADDIPQNKLELAKAYLALGDKEQAKAPLQEVLAEGNPAQQEQARVLLAQLGQ